MGPLDRRQYKSHNLFIDLLLIMGKKKKNTITVDEGSIGPKSSLALISHGSQLSQGRTRSGRVFKAASTTQSNSQHPRDLDVMATIPATINPVPAVEHCRLIENAHVILPCLSDLGLLSISNIRLLRAVSRGLRALLVNDVRKIRVTVREHPSIYRELELAVAAFPYAASFELIGSMDVKVSIASLAGLNSLKSLDLTDAPRIHSSDLSVIARELTQLTELKLQRPEDTPLRRMSQISASDLAQLSSLQSLQSLQFGIFGDTTKQHILAICSITSLRSLEIYDSSRHGCYMMGTDEIKALAKLSRLESLWFPLPSNSHINVQEETAWEETVSSLLKSLKRLRSHSNYLPLFFVEAVSQALRQSKTPKLDLLAFYVEHGIGEEPLEGFDPSGLRKVKTLELHIYKMVSIASIQWLLSLPNLKPFQVLSAQTGNPYQETEDGMIVGGWMNGGVSWHHHSRHSMIQSI